MPGGDSHPPDRARLQAHCHGHLGRAGRAETLRTVMERAEFSLLGNHEHGAMFYASDFNPRARAAIVFHARAALEP